MMMTLEEKILSEGNCIRGNFYDVIRGRNFYVGDRTFVRNYVEEVIGGVVYNAREIIGEVRVLVHFQNEDEVVARFDDFMYDTEPTEWEMNDTYGYYDNPTSDNAGLDPAFRNWSDYWNYIGIPC